MLKLVQGGPQGAAIVSLENEARGGAGQEGALIDAVCSTGRAAGWWRR